MSDDEREWTPDLDRLTQAADDSFAVGRVFGQAYEQDGTLVIPVARVLGAAAIGSGGGGGSWSGSGTGSGGSNWSGHGSGSGRLSLLRRFGSGGGDTAELASAPADAAHSADDTASTDTESSQSPQGDTGADGNAQAEAKGDLKGEARGDAHGDGGSGGGTYGVRVKPVGVVVVEQGHARFIPVLDLNRVILGGQAAAAVGALALGWALRHRRRH
jgi:uncharacterized spore protein YtfJ